MLVSMTGYGHAQAESKRLGEAVAIIGRITDPSVQTFISKQGKHLPLTAQGWQHFNKKD